ncbi:MAG: serine hydrolase [Bacteroidetes bacterium]|nr:serine hydrolase [Bacteroidota bacterium]
MNTLKLIACLILTSCCSSSRTNRSQKNVGSGIITDGLIKVNADSLKLTELNTAIASDSFPNTHSILLMKDDVLFYENYFEGCDQNNGKQLGLVSHNANTLHDCRSITKTVVSACIGIAIKKGLISSVDERVKKYFPEYADFFEGQKDNITIKHLLTMTSGLAWNEHTSYANPFNSEIQMNLRKNPVKYVLKQKLEFDPASHWNYSGGNTQVLAAIIEKVSGKKIDEFAKENLFSKLGIDNTEWQTLLFQRSLPSAASGLRLTSREMLHIGSLFTNDGFFNGSQILDTSWVVNSFKNAIDRNTLKKIKPGGYGYQFWNYNEMINGKPYYIVEAKGNGGNSILICKELNLIMVITAGNYNKFDLMNNPLKIFSNYVIPAVMQKK